MDEDEDWESSDGCPICDHAHALAITVSAGKEIRTCDNCGWSETFHVMQTKPAAEVFQQIGEIEKSADNALALHFLADISE